MEATTKTPRIIDGRPQDEKVRARMVRDFGKDAAAALELRPILSLNRGLYSRYNLLILGAFKGQQIVATYRGRRDRRVEGAKIYPGSEWVAPGEHWIPATDTDLAALEER